MDSVVLGEASEVVLEASVVGVTVANRVAMDVPVHQVVGVTVANGVAMDVPVHQVVVTPVGRRVMYPTTELR